MAGNACHKRRFDAAKSSVLAIAYMDPTSRGTGSPLTRTQEILTWLFGFFFFITVALTGFAPQIIYPDMGWHLTQGGWIVHHLQFLRHDLFNYPVLNAPLISEYPAYQVIIWLAWQFGEYGAATLCAVTLLVLYSLFFWSARQLRIPSALLTISLLLTLLNGLKRFTLRPELATSLGIVFFMTFLLRHRDETDWKKFWPLALAQILWTNSHSGFILGIALTCGFAIETILRAAWRERRLPIARIRCWSAVAVIVTLASFINPYGLPRLLLPFYHQGSEVIRAYVGEMQPMIFDTNDFFVDVMLVQLALIFLAFVLYRGGISWTFLAITLFFFKETFVSGRHIAVFALLVPGVILSTKALGRPLIETRENQPLRPALEAIRLFTVLISTLGVLLILKGEVLSDSTISPFTRWRAWNHNQTELPISATRWMLQNHITGRLFHRSEIGGWLQYRGYDHGETYCDTGFGKFSEDFIHEIGLSSGRPNYLPVLLRKYNPACTVVAGMGYNWPHVLIQNGWRCVYYAPDGSVWLPKDARPELPIVTQAEVEESFAHSIQENVLPVPTFVRFWRLLALHSMGYEDFAVEQLLKVPASWQHSPLFWETISRMAFTAPGLNEVHLEFFNTLAHKTENLSSSLPFRAELQLTHKNFQAVVDLVDPLSRQVPNDAAFTTLGSAWIELGQFEKALKLLRCDDLFDLSNGERYHLLAVCEEHSGNADAAKSANARAHFYSPDLWPAPVQ